MSSTIDKAFVAEFERDLHEEFQQRGSKLVSLVRKREGVVGNTDSFQKIGKGSATSKTRDGVVPPMNVDHSAVSCSLSDHYAGDWVDKLDEIKTKHDERAALVRAGAAALGRKADNLVITAMDGTTSAVGDYTTALSKSLLLEAFEQLNANDVPDDGQRFGVLAPHAWNEALNINQFASADFVGSDLPFLKGTQARTWLGIHWLMHTGLPLANVDDRTCFVWHRSALGLAIGANVTTDVSWHGDRAAHFVNSYMSMGACLIDANGVVEIRVDDNTAIV